eukprot:Gb_25372 [translate_table: standard]
MVNEQEGDTLDNALAMQGNKYEVEQDEGEMGYNLYFDNQEDAGFHEVLCPKKPQLEPTSVTTSMDPLRFTNNPSNESTHKIILPSIHNEAGREKYKKSKDPNEKIRRYEIKFRGKIIEDKHTSPINKIEDTTNLERIQPFVKNSKSSLGDLDHNIPNDNCVTKKPSCDSCTTTKEKVISSYYPSEETQPTNRQRSYQSKLDQSSQPSMGPPLQTSITAKKHDLHSTSRNKKKKTHDHLSQANRSQPKSNPFCVTQGNMEGNCQLRKLEVNCDSEKILSIKKMHLHQQPKSLASWTLNPFRNKWAEMERYVPKLVTKQEQPQPQPQFSRQSGNSNPPNQFSGTFESTPEIRLTPKSKFVLRKKWEKVKASERKVNQRNNEGQGMVILDYVRSLTNGTNPSVMENIPEARGDSLNLAELKLFTNPLTTYSPKIFGSVSSLEVLDVKNQFCYMPIQKRKYEFKFESLRLIWWLSVHRNVARLRILSNRSFGFFWACTAHPRHQEITMIHHYVDST